MTSYTFLTVKSVSSGIYKEKGSRFIARAYPVSNTQEIKAVIEKLRKEHHSAKHLCFAYMLGHDKPEWRVSDDGEPPGTAGKPILGQINAFNLTNILVVVIRYFGGTLLGTGGLINAYRTAAASAISSGVIIRKTVRSTILIEFPYIAMNDVMKVLKEKNIVISNQDFDSECRIKVSLPVSDKGRITGKLSLIKGLSLNQIDNN